LNALESVSTAAAINQAAEMLVAAGVRDARSDAAQLAAHVWNCAPDLVDEMSEKSIPPEFWELVDRRAAREPVELITGHAYFCGLRLMVRPGVFVPKPETRELVARVLDRIRALETKQPLIVDLCTGSGAVALSVAHGFPGARVTGVDLSAEACALAEQNADNLGLEAEFVCADAADALKELDGTVDVLVANPPYIPLGYAIRDPEARDHDPALALWAGPDGLDVVRAVEQAARRLLAPGGWIFLEHGLYQAEPVLRLFSADNGWHDAQVHETVDDGILTSRRSAVR
jgi:release factor glutamine methyltransferase